MTTAITHALDVAGVRVAARDFGGAIDHLEAALAGFTPTPPAVWHLETVLAALYDRVGRPERARAIARRALVHATDSRDEVARERASALLAKLSAPKPATTPRLARGSHWHPGR
nr:hypothetical protein [Kofleriaceae bacterium]